MLGAQSLGDVARREEERRKALGSTGKKVYTNEDLGSAALAPAPPPAADAAAGDKPADDKPGDGGDAAKGSTAEAAKDGAAAAAKEEEQPARDQAYWRDRMLSLRTALDREQTYVEALQSRINALTTDYVNRDDPAQRDGIAVDRQRAIDEMDRLKKQIEDTRKSIADLEDEARRANVPPGWLR